MMSNFSLGYIWEIPLAFLSFLAYKIARFFIGNLYTLYLAINRKISVSWRVLSQDTIDSPLSLPVLMTKGPRWNTHAIIGTLGPFFVGNYLELDSIAASSSAASWIAIFYSFPEYKTVATIESEKITNSDRWQKLQLPTGKYTIGLRYYNTKEKLVLPAIKTDDRDFALETEVPNDVNSFYCNLASYSNWFYLSLHYYIFTILKLRRYLPESFVKYEYLPVGATDTFFAYDYLAKDRELQIEFFPNFFSEYELYLTFYNRASFPVAWLQLHESDLTEDRYIDERHSENLSYLIRIRDRTSGANNFLDRLSAVYTADDRTQYLKIISR